LAGHTSSVNAVAAVPLPDGQVLLASGGADRTVRWWDPATGTPVAVMRLAGSAGSLAATNSQTVAGVGGSLAAFVYRPADA
jgi:WD40 repeat protein